MAPKKPVRGMAQLKKELDEGTIRKLYLLYGSERYLIRQYKELLLSRVTNPGDTMNFASYQGASADIRTILSDLSTMPFLAEHRVVLVEDSGFFTKSVDELTDSLPDLPDTAILIFVEPDVEKSTGLTKAVDKRGRLFKLFDQAEGAFCFDVPDEATLRSWITGRLAETGKKVEAKVPERLLSAVGQDMSTLDSELEKLISYTLEKDAIRVADVEAISVTIAEDKVFDMVDAISAKNKEKTLLLCNDLLELREPVMKILYLISRQYQILAQVAQMQTDGTPRENMAKIAGFLPFLVKKYQSLAASYTKAQLLSACDACLAADQAIKTGLLSDRNALERLILDLLSPEAKS
jgi:DNA polymerase-3 subunit delta